MKRRDLLSLACALLLTGLAPVPVLHPPVRAEQPASWSVGDKVLVLWKGTWYKATVIGARPDAYRIHYTGYASSWDEWVAAGRIRSVERPPAPAAEWKVGDRIEVLWKRSWYKATIIGVKPGLYRIHYTGYASSWDEWVGPGRVRAAR